MLVELTNNRNRDLNFDMVELDLACPGAQSMVRVNIVDWATAVDFD